MNTDRIKIYLLDLQKNICSKIQEEDGQAFFCKDSWDKVNLGGGHTCTLANGKVFEKAGVNYSHVKASKLPPSASKIRPELANNPFEAQGVSLVIHPLNPYVPTVHFNVRYFEVQFNQNKVCWFGGGMDLTPYYPFKEDAIFWHQACKKACQSTPEGTYESFKKQCDEYFFLPHRNETRGIGGLFFDDLNWDFEKSFTFIQDLGEQFLKAYLPIVQKRKNTPFTQKQIDFHSYRRGRYVEFNLLFDRGTIFGIQSKGRTESILVSMPPRASWAYNWSPDPNTPEVELYNYFLKPQDWLTQ